MPVFFVNSYAPLAFTRVGRVASKEHNVPPFVDGSIRREPDFEHPFPAITCLCRGKNFAPRLKVGDIVAYVTKKATYGTSCAHQRLTTVLRVLGVFDSHAAGADWYHRRGLPLPNNCMVAGNSAVPLRRSHCICGSCGGRKRTHREWDAEYRRRAREYGTFVVCKPLRCDISWSAPVVSDEQFAEALGGVPATRNPGARTLDELQRFMRVMGISIPRFAR